MQLSFKPLTVEDLTHLHNWFQEPVIKQHYAKNKSWSFNDLLNKYHPRIIGTENIPSFIIELDTHPIGFIQYYCLQEHFPECIKDDINPLFDNYSTNKIVGIDLFIAYNKNRGKGLGVQIINQFIREFLMQYKLIVVDPEKNNLQAIRCYEKSGFKLTTFSADDSHILLIKDHETSINIDTILVTKLIKQQFPQWQDLSIKPVAKSGWDNRTFHLGDEMVVRLPSNAEYAPQILKENHWLPILAKKLSCQITTPIALGNPDVDYPWHWSINHWIQGSTASINNIPDLNKFGHDLGQFLTEFQAIESTNGPIAGPHNFYRGGNLSAYDHEMQIAIPKIQDPNTRSIAAMLWEDALSSHWDKKPVWVHGDLAVGNILVNNGVLCAVIDFGQLAIGDPACDLAIAWNFFHGKSLDAFKKSITLDENTWIRALGWTLWKTLCWPVNVNDADRILNNVYNDYKQRK